MAPSPGLDHILTEADAIRGIGSKLNILAASRAFMVSEESFMIDDLTLRRLDRIAYNGVYSPVNMDLKAYFGTSNLIR
jgi:hypothetical protein